MPGFLKKLKREEKASLALNELRAEMAMATKGERDKDKKAAALLETALWAHVLDSCMLKWLH